MTASNPQPSGSSIDDQITRITAGLFSPNCGVSALSTWATVDGMGLVIANVLGENANVRFAVWLATDLPFSRELVEKVSSMNSQTQFGSITLYVGDDSCTLLLTYDFMRPWLEEIPLNHLGVAQPLLDIIGNLPKLASAISDEITAELGGRRPNPSGDAWDVIPMMMM